MKPAEKQGYKDASRYSHLTPEELEEYAARQGATNADYARGMRIYAEEMKRYVPEQRNPASQKPSSSSIKTLQQAHKQDQERDRAEQQGYTDAPKIGHLPPHEFEAYAASQDANNADYARGLRRYAQERAYQNQKKERADQQGYTDAKHSDLTPEELETYAADQRTDPEYARGLRRYAQEQGKIKPQKPSSSSSSSSMQLTPMTPKEEYEYQIGKGRQFVNSKGVDDARKAVESGQIKDLNFLQGVNQEIEYLSSKKPSSSSSSSSSSSHIPNLKGDALQGYKDAPKLAHLTPEEFEAYAIGPHSNPEYASGMRRYAQERQRAEQQGYEYVSRYSYLTPEDLERYAANQDAVGDADYAKGMRRYAQEQKMREPQQIQKHIQELENQKKGERSLSLEEYLGKREQERLDRTHREKRISEGREWANSHNYDYAREEISSGKIKDIDFLEGAKKGLDERKHLQSSSSSSSSSQQEKQSKDIQEDYRRLLSNNHFFPNQPFAKRSSEALRLVQDRNSYQAVLEDLERQQSLQQAQKEQQEKMKSSSAAQKQNQDLFYEQMQPFISYNSFANPAILSAFQKIQSESLNPVQIHDVLNPIYSPENIHRPGPRRQSIMDRTAELFDPSLFSPESESDEDIEPYFD